MNHVHAAIFCVMWAGANGCAHAENTRSTVCEIAAGGKSEIGRVVRLNADYNATLGHGGHLSDPRCPQRILGDLTPNSGQDESVAKFYAALPDSLDPAPLSYNFSVDATVRIVSTQNASTELGWARPPLAVELLTVWSFSKRP